jgi:type II secretory pathway pseudopilin PulG
MCANLSRSRLHLTRTAFTLVEALIVIAVIGVLVALTIPQISTTRKAVSDTKLSTDVARLNSLIAVYVASGGSVDGAATVQDVLDRLKTRRTNADASRTVFPMTGRVADVRLGVRMQSAAEASRSSEPRAVWNATTRKFEIAYSGAPGIASFTVDDTLAKDYGTETRAKTSVQYNGNNNGWVWESGSGAGPASLTPADATLGTPSQSPFNPSGGGTTVTPPLTSLPAPVIAPNGGSFLAAAFPTTATLSSNGAPLVGSRISYMIIHADSTYTAWTTYSTAIPLIFGDTVLAYNQTTLPLLYVDSAQSRQTFIRTVGTLPAPIITPNGGQFMKGSVPTSVTISANSAPGGVWSKLKYRKTSATGTVGAWTNYSSAFTVALGDTVEAKNFSLDTTSYNDSPSDSETYAAMVTQLPNPLISPSGGGFDATSFPSSITIDRNGPPTGAADTKYKILRADGTTRVNWTIYNSGSIAINYGETVLAQNFTKDTDYYTDSDIDQETYTLSTVIKLPPPILTEVTISGKQYVTIVADTSAGVTIPTGSYIYYTITNTDPGVRASDDTPLTGTKYDPNHPPAVPGKASEFIVTARLYPPKTAVAAAGYDTSDTGDIDIDLPAAASPGLANGHIDVDTSHLLYPFGQGRTDAHQHAYDDKYSTTGVNLMGFGDGKTRLVNVQAQIPAGVRFKIIVSNANLSSGGRLVINKDYNENDVSTYVGVSAYDDTALASLPVYTTNGVTGTTKLTSLGVYFLASAISSGQVNPSSTGLVKSNTPGPGGVWRSGALTIQAVKVNSDMTDGFTTNPAYSAGGVQGTATSGLLWECTIFWHKQGL